jgi:hypothetical protein
MLNYHKVVDYLYETLGIKIVINKTATSKNFPYYLESNFDFYSIKIMNHDYFLIIPKREIDLSPAQINNYVGVIREKTRRDMIFCLPKISSFIRKRLIEYKIPFIVPGNQMYIPDLGIDLREYFRNKKQILEKISPSTQVILLDSILNHDYTPKTTSLLSNKLHYSVMTIIRAFDELEANQIAENKMQGKERVLQFYQNGRELWDKVYPFLRNPITKKLFVNPFKHKEELLLSGITALSTYSMINESEHRTFAMSREEYKRMKLQNQIDELEYPNQDSYEIEIWRYSPRLLSQSHTVDLLSLYLSLKETKDARVEIALESLLEKVKW